MFLPRFLAMGFDPVRAVWDAVFMAISVFNNAGFVILPGGLAPHVTDWWMLIPIILGTTVGAIGFPVIMDVAKNLRTPRRWRLHTKLTLSTYLILAFVGALAMALTEWHNPTTLGAIDTPSKILNAMLAGVNSRSSGLSALDVGAMHSQTHFVQDILMMIGGGSASTAGGVKVTTFAVLVLAVIAEARGDRDIETFGRRIPTSTIRLSVAVSLLGLALVAISVVLLLSMTEYTLDIILLETVSAFATVGLSTGITPILPVGAKYVLIILMFAGRTGSMTVAAALAQQTRPQRAPRTGPTGTKLSRHAQKHRNPAISREQGEFSPASNTNPPLTRYKTLPATATPGLNRYKTLPATPTRWPNRYKTLPARPQSTKSGHATEQGELSPGSTTTLVPISTQLTDWSPLSPGHQTNAPLSWALCGLSAAHHDVAPKRAGTDRRLADWNWPRHPQASSEQLNPEQARLA